MFYELTASLSGGTARHQVDLLKHEKNSIAYVLYRMDQKVTTAARALRSV